jgi:hypothetical protein
MEGSLAQLKSLLFSISNRPLRTWMCSWGRRMEIGVRDGMAVQAVADSDLQYKA